MLNLAHGLELIVDGFNDGSLPKQQLVRQGEQTIGHVFAEFGNQVKAVSHEQLFSKGLREIAFVAKEFAKEVSSQLGNGVPIIAVAGRQTEGEQVALIIDHQVQLEAKEPANGSLATSRSSGKDPMLMNASVVTDFQRGRIDETDTGTVNELCMQVGDQRYQQGWHQFDKAMITHYRGKFAAEVNLHVVGVICLEGTIVRLMEPDGMVIISLGCIWVARLRCRWSVESKLTCHS